MVRPVSRIVISWQRAALQKTRKIAHGPRTKRLSTLLRRGCNRWEWSYFAQPNEV